MDTDDYRKKRQREQKREWARQRRRRERESLEKLQQENRELVEYNEQLRNDVFHLRDRERRMLLKLRNIRIGSNRRKSVPSRNLVLLGSCSRSVMTSSVAVRHARSSSQVSLPFSNYSVSPVKSSSAPCTSYSSSSKVQEEAIAEQLLNVIYDSVNQRQEMADDTDFDISSSQSSTNSEESPVPFQSTTEILPSSQVSTVDDSSFTDEATPLSQSSVTSGNATVFNIILSSMTKEESFPSSQSLAGLTDDCFPVSTSSEPMESSSPPLSQSSPSKQDGRYTRRAFPRSSSDSSTDLRVCRLAAKEKAMTKCETMSSPSASSTSSGPIDIKAPVQTYDVNVVDDLHDQDISIPCGSMGTVVKLDPDIIDGVRLSRCVSAGKGMDRVSSAVRTETMVPLRSSTPVHSSQTTVVPIYDLMYEDGTDAKDMVIPHPHTEGVMRKTPVNAFCPITDCDARSVQTDEHCEGIPAPVKSEAVIAVSGASLSRGSPDISALLRTYGVCSEDVI